ncbi:MAG: sigma-70 family RNA polymerase sigma factor [Phycisphaerales bacterium]|nr:sigma-70 family RNA polymerase sigma factor [Phycisphaerales bacterium]
MNNTETPSNESHFPQNQGAEYQRAHAAQLVEQQRATLLSRIHSLLGDDARRVTDTDDILSTSLRRIDHAIHQGSLEAQNERQFYAFVHGVIERTILEKSQKSRGLTARERIAQVMKDHVSSPAIEQRVIASEELNRIGEMITDPIDREIILLRGRDLSLADIARTMNMTPAAARKRWSRIRTMVREYIKEDSSDEDR